ncbi:MAG TPA: S1 family peptidase [Natronosporangium sp.]|nr:S1 family peptidase [Natronosporangium sp.]
MDRRKSLMVGAAVLSLGLATVMLPSPASASPLSPANAAPDTITVSSDMLAAMERDLGLSADEAQRVMALEYAASQTEAALQESLASEFGGAWLNDQRQLMVGITDATLADEVRAAGAHPVLVTNSLATLDAAVDTLNSGATPDASEVYGWHVDVTTNEVVVQAAPGATDAALAWLESTGVDSTLVRIEVSTEAPQLFYDIIGGYPYYPGNSRCSIGFSVSGGFVTAGHCGRAGTSVRGHNNVAMGSVAGSIFPGRDMAWVRTNSSWTPRPWVYLWNGSVRNVTGSSEAAVGASVCRSGSTTGWYCGTIQAKNQTVNYPQGTVRYLTRTNVCAEPGDSGGSFISGNQAQGVTSGGSGNCRTGGTTFFQPVNPILSQWGLSLTRA